MIQSFRGKHTERLFHREPVPEFRAFERAAQRKLAMLHAAHSLADLRSPPGNRLEVLHGDRAGRYSIRINQRWRLCFAWNDANAYEVEIVDYH